MSCWCGQRANGLHDLVQLVGLPDPQHPSFTAIFDTDHGVFAKNISFDARVRICILILFNKSF